MCGDGGKYFTKHLSRQFLNHASSTTLSSIVVHKFSGFKKRVQGFVAKMTHEKRILVKPMFIIAGPFLELNYDWLYTYLSSNHLDLNLNSALFFKEFQSYSFTVPFADNFEPTGIPTIDVSVMVKSQCFIIMKSLIKLNFYFSQFPCLLSRKFSKC